MGQHRGGQALHRNRKIHDQLRRVRRHRRRGRHGTYLGAELEPHQDSFRGVQGGRHHGGLRHLLRPREAEDFPGRQGPQRGPLAGVYGQVRRGRRGFRPHRKADDLRRFRRGSSRRGRLDSHLPDCRSPHRETGGRAVRRSDCGRQDHRCG